MRKSPFDVTGIIGGILGAELEDPNNPLKLAQAQADLAEKDTSSFINSILSVHLNEALSKNMPLFPGLPRIPSEAD